MQDILPKHQNLFHNDIDDDANDVSTTTILLSFSPKTFKVITTYITFISQVEML